MNLPAAIFLMAALLLGTFSLLLLWVLAQSYRFIDRLDAENRTLQENNKHLLKVNLELSTAVITARKGSWEGTR